MTIPCGAERLVARIRSDAIRDHAVAVDVPRIHRNVMYRCEQAFRPAGS
jgi:hypothetical protein